MGKIKEGERFKKESRQRKAQIVYSSKDRIFMEKGIVIKSCKNIAKYRVTRIATFLNVICRCFKVDTAYLEIILKSK